MPERPGPKAKKNAGKTRRDELRRRIPVNRQMSWRAWLTQPESLPTVAVLVGFVLMASLVVGGFRGTRTIAPGRVMDETRAVRVAFEAPDLEATEREREIARRSTPRVYRADSAYFEELENSLTTLPKALAAAETFETVAGGIVETFRLTPDGFAAIRGEVGEDGQVTPAWRERVSRLRRALLVTPMLDLTEYQRALQDPRDIVRLVGPAGVMRDASKRDGFGVGGDGPPSELVSERLSRLVRDAGFTGEASDAVVARLEVAGRPLFVFDREATDRARAEAASRVEAVVTQNRVGDVIYREGETLSEEAFLRAEEEQEHYLAAAPMWARVLRALGVIGIVSVVAAAVAAYCRFFYAEMFRDPWRAAALAGMSVVLLATSCWGVASQPGLAWLMVLSPTAFLSMTLVIAFDRRIGLLATGAQAILLGLALDLTVGVVAAALVGSMVANWRLAEVRNRRDMVRGGLAVAVGLALAVLAIGLVERPPVWGAALETMADSLQSGLGGFVAASVTLVIMPWLERAFGVTTGMTLSELRDPKHPLLRELQQRAPGTYNHSLNVATLAESAANAIGANGLHVYVGALYHDIGKMNKPDYFVENQPRGFNRHDKLSPAMSLLVIVGHVKDGVELARAHGLPKTLHHYIESHHGTTLVEYFYDQAKRRASVEEGVEAPAEIEYRYPGPKPRTREAAILMLCDGVESATRAMAEPTPSRIQQLVHAMAQKRLHDGQFDDSNLTLREIAVVEDALTKSLCAIYHGRIAYPKADEDEPGVKAERVAAEQGA
jgi:putative nucleotidyltransferase with HDIG domain